MKKKAVSFIGIGGHKCASTWLWYNLRSHPQVWVPPQKELHYHDRGNKYPSTGELGTERLLDRVFGTKSIDVKWRKVAIRNLAGSIVRLDLERLKWWFKFYPRRFDDEWYVNLFENHDCVSAGEITPAYSMLDVSDIKHLDLLCPDVRIIYVIRDPIERAWSHIRFDAGLGHIEDLSDLDEVKQYINGGALTKRGDYLSTLNNWLAVIPEDRFFLGFYDDIKLDSELFLENLSAFLEIDSKGFPKQGVSKSVGVSKTMEMPVEIGEYLASKYLLELEKLTSVVGSHSFKWLESARARLAE